MCPPQEDGKHAALLEQARARLRAGDAAGAEVLARQVLAAEARNPVALLLLGVVALGRRDPAAAAAHFRESLAVDPSQVQAWSNLGAACQALGREPEAIDAFRRALALRPDHAGALNNLGVLHLRRSELDEAEGCFSRALAASSADAEVHNNLGNLHLRRGRLEPALACYRRALELKPASAEALGNLGNALLRLGRQPDALAALRRAAELRPGNPDALFNLGNALASGEQLADAVACYRRALELRPGAAEIRDRLLHAQQRVCDWRDLEALAQSQREALRSQPQAVISPFSIACLPTSAEEQLLAARSWCRNMLAPFERLQGRLGAPPAPGARAKLRIGYLSGDFREHAVARLVVELFEVHDRSGFEVLGYSFGPPDASALRQRLAGAFERFTEIGALSHEDAAQRIRADGVDILVDLGGYTQYSRAEVLALRPAPLQVHYLGHPGTMGAGFVDYLLTDHFLTPPQLAPFCAEHPVYLPSHQVNDRRRANDAIVTRAELGLPEEAFVYCCAAQGYKIWPATFEAWMRILQAVPGSVLWLAQSNPWMAANLRREAASRGVDPQRLAFAPPAPYELYLARLALADLFLDTLPFNAHATAADALWMGLPVLSCPGQAHPGRLAGSILVAAGMPELLAASGDDYEARAVALGRDRAAAAALRSKLERARDSCALFDTPRFARALERAFREMWRRYSSGEPPAPIDVASAP